MKAAIARLARAARRTRFHQAARLLELAARTAGDGRHHGSVGEDVALDREPLRFQASDRMQLPVGDLAEVRQGEGAPVVVANVMGLIGATPVMPAYYSEVQLQRRRLRDPSMAAFYNIFDHRSLSFFHRAGRKYRWLLEHERLGEGAVDPVSHALVSYAGLPTGATRGRLHLADVALAPVASHLGDRRRGRAGVEAVLRHLTGLDLRVREAVPTWLAVPADGQTRLGGLGQGRCQRLGEPRGGEFAVEADAAMVGASVLDVTQGYEVEVGPLDAAAFARFVGDEDQVARLADACRLAAGGERRPRLRLLLRREEAPPCRLGTPSARLSRTSWLGSLADAPEILRDCILPIG